MRIVPEVASVIGPTSETRWGQALITPLLYGVVEIEEAAGGAMKLGVDVLGKLTMDKEFSGGLGDLERLAHRPEGRWIRTIILLVPWGGVIYVVLHGAGRVYLKRGEKLARLIENERGISGQVRRGDILLLASERFTSALSEDEISSVFDHEDAHGVSEKLTLKLHESGNGDGGAALIFEVKNIAESETFAPEKTQAVAQPQRAKLGKLIASLPKRKLILGIVTACIILFFMVSIAIGIARQQAARKNDEVARVLSEAQRLTEEGNALLDLNPTKGRERLQSAHDLLKPLTETIPEKSEQGRHVFELFAAIREQLTMAKNSVLGELQVFFDPGLLKNGSRVDSIALYEDIAALLDWQSRTVYTLDIPSKKGEIVAGGNAYSKSKLIAIHGESIYVLTDDQIVSTNVRKSEEWKSISALSAYGGNLYLLDSGASRIWKYVATDSGFSKINEYLNPDVFVDLSGATSLAIDGAVWIGTSEGQIIRFVQGRQETFVPQGVDPAIAGRVVVYASDATNNLYILEPAAKRVVVLDKEGMYLGQYVWQGEIVPTALVTSEEQKKILLLAAGRVYSLELK